MSSALFRCDSRFARVFDAALIALFAASLAAPSLDHLARPDEARSALREKRKPAARPEKPATLEALSAYPHRFESWFDDRLGLRDVLLRGHQALQLFVLGSEPSPTMVVGRNSWLYFGAENTMSIGRGLDPMSPARLASWQRAIEQRRDWLRLRGIAYVFVIAPNKEAIYPEFLPASMTKIGPTQLDQLTERLARSSDVEFLDLRPALRAEKEHDEPGDFVYQPLGSHFTWRGGWAACNAILARVRGHDAPDLGIDRVQCRRERIAESQGDSFGETMYIGDLLHQDVFGFTQREGVRAQFALDAEGASTGRSEIDDPTLPKIVLVHDSFGPWIVPYLSQRCSRLITFHGYSLPRKLIQDTQPDVVVEMFTERGLRGELPPLPLELEEIDRARFESATTLWGPLDLGARPPSLTIQGGMIAEPRDHELDLVLQRSDGGVVIPASVLPAGSELALHVDITVPAAAILSLGYQLEDARGFSRARMAEIGAHAGRNDLYLRVRVPKITGTLLFRSGGPLGNYTLHALEARAIR